MQKLGLIAGNRRFPIMVAEAASKKGEQVVAVAIRGETSASIKKYAEKVYWIDLNEIEKAFEVLKSEGVSKVIMAGQVSPRLLFSRKLKEGRQSSVLLDSLKDKKADTILGAVAVRLEKEGLEVLDSTIFLKDSLAKKGVLTRKQPSPQVREDIDFGFDLAKSVAALDIGQTVAVRSKVIVAVEAFEGTDNLIKRAGRLARGGITVVKVSKPRQDMRFDVPVVGIKTIKQLAKVKAKCLAIEADKTLLIDREDCISLADKKGISVIAL
ncbi:LpxI family protein [Candidatus Omnitrophota bacterium]